MRISGSLFTYAEMSASIHDNTFDAGVTAILTPDNNIATVLDAVNMLNVDPLNGPNNRCPSWDELYRSDITPGFRVVLNSNPGLLTANAYSGTPPYNYYFSCSPVGRCSNYRFGNPTQLNVTGPATTSITTFESCQSRVFKEFFTIPIGQFILNL